LNAKYEGFWFEDMQQGQGIETWGLPGDSQATFIGNFFKGKKNGKGRF
jgi:hypothetical protein